jgi:hypothetical protein
VSRRPKNTGNGVSLFPFMSILACLIGILTLMISVMMQVQQMEHEGRTEEEMERAINNRDLKKKAETLSQEIKRLDQQLNKDHASTVEMKKLSDQKIALTLKLDEIKKAKDNKNADIALQKQVENLKKEIAAIKNERPALNQKLKELQAELKARKEAPKPKESVVVQPRGVGSRGAKNIFFVECTSTGIVIISPQKPRKTISTAAIRTSGVYNSHLDKVKKTRDSMILFLIRKSGNASYLWAAGIAETKYKVTTGKLPVPNDGKIDLSLFKN